MKDTPEKIPTGDVDALKPDEAARASAAIELSDEAKREEIWNAALRALTVAEEVYTVLMAMDPPRRVRVALEPLRLVLGIPESKVPEKQQSLIIQRDKKIIQI